MVGVKVGLLRFLADVYRIMSGEQEVGKRAFLLTAHYLAVLLPAVLFPVSDFYTISLSPVPYFALSCTFHLSVLNLTFSFQCAFAFYFARFILPVLSFPYISSNSAVTAPSTASDLNSITPTSEFNPSTFSTTTYYNGMRPAFNAIDKLDEWLEAFLVNTAGHLSDAHQLCGTAR